MKIMEEFERQTDIRLKLLEQGYRPLPTASKIAFLKGWQAIPVDARRVKKWPMSISPGGYTDPAVTTAIQMTGNMVGIDVDVTDKDVVEQLFIMAEDCFGDDWAERVLIRVGKSPKELWLFKTDEPYKMWKTPRYVDPDGNDHMVEVYGGAATRYFSCFGPHSLVTDEETGKPVISKGAYQVKNWYQWIGGHGDGGSTGGKMDPLHVSIDQLVEVPVNKLRTFLNAANDLMAEWPNWEKVENTKGGEFEGGVVYDLTEDMMFDTQEYGELDYTGAMEFAAYDRDARCSASWLDGVRHKNKSRCRMSVAGNADDGYILQVFDHESWELHLPRSEAPQTDEERNQSMAALGSALVNLDLDLDDLDEAEEAGADIDEFVAVVEDLMETLAFNVETGNYHRIRSGSIWNEVSRSTLKADYRQYDLKWEGPRGGKRRMSVIDTWEQQADRIKVSGVRFNPKTEDRTYEDNGLQWLNGWFGLPELPKAYTEDVKLVRQFLEHLVPNKDERHFLLDWLVTKYQNPSLRMCAILFLSPNIGGTGRGTFYEICRTMFGAHASKLTEQVLFEKHNGWMEQTVLAMVDEVGASTRYADKAAEYQKLKDIIDPANRFVSIRKMRMDAYTTEVFTSMMMATNNIRGVMLDDEDRRIAVLRNGVCLNEVGGWADELMSLFNTADGRTRLAAGLRAMLVGHLVRHNRQQLTTPPRFEGWYAMLEAGGTELDEAVAKVIEDAEEGAAWPIGRFRDMVRIEMFGTSQNQRNDGVAATLKELTGARADHVGATHLSRIIVVDNSGTKKRVTVIARDPEAFLALSWPDRWAALQGQVPKHPSNVTAFPRPK